MGAFLKAHSKYLKISYYVVSYSCTLTFTVIISTEIHTWLEGKLSVSGESDSTNILCTKFTKLITRLWDIFRKAHWRPNGTYRVSHAKGDNKGSIERLFYLLSLLKKSACSVRNFPKLFSVTWLGHMITGAGTRDNFGPYPKLSLVTLHPYDKH